MAVLWHGAHLVWCCHWPALRICLQHSAPLWDGVLGNTKTKNGLKNIYTNQNNDVELFLLLESLQIALLLIFALPPPTSFPLQERMFIWVLAPVRSTDRCYVTEPSLQSSVEWENHCRSWLDRFGVRVGTQILEEDWGWGLGISHFRDEKLSFEDKRDDNRLPRGGKLFVRRKLSSIPYLTRRLGSSLQALEHSTHCCSPFCSRVGWRLGSVFWLNLSFYSVWLLESARGGRDSWLQFWCPESLVKEDDHMGVEMMW